MKLLLLALGLMLILEGLPYFAFPEKIKKWLLKVAEMEASQLRLFGLAAMVLGLAMIYAVQRH